MVADGTLDMIVTLSWVGVLALVLVAQAFVAWLTHRQVSKSVRMAERLARATAPRPSSEPGPAAPVPVALLERPRLSVVPRSHEAAG